MAKIMLVEDDNNLREIYEARLLAEGYEIVSAKDGEEALALAVKEKPDLIISDVMMPKISGFDMLDILRSTPETKDTKVIMMTALSQAEDKSRADKLGADRYLVKSQVTLEDVAKVAREVLQGDSPTAKPTSPAPSDNTPPASGTPTAPPSEPPTPPVEPIAGNDSPQDSPAAQTVPVAEPPADPPQPATSDNPTPTPLPPADDNVAKAADEAEKLTDAVNDVLESNKPDDKEDGEGGENPSTRKKVIQPINDLSVKPDLDALLEKEGQQENTTPPASSVVTPGGPVVTPPSPDQPADPTKPGNVIQGGHDPNSIAI